MTTFLTLGLLSGKCSHGANFKYIKYSFLKDERDRNHRIKSYIGSGSASK